MKKKSLKNACRFHARLTYALKRWGARAASAQARDSFSKRNLDTFQIAKYAEVLD
jgi:hypothetical protein